MRERCSENAFCEVCRFGTFNGECRASEKQREKIGIYGGYENFELIDFCYQKDQRIAELEEQLKNAIVPKFKYHQVVYVLCNTDIIKGQIDGFDYYNKKYLVWLMGFGMGNEWCYEHEIFATREEAQAKLKELQGEKYVKD